MATTTDGKFTPTARLTGALPALQRAAEELARAVAMDPLVRTARAAAAVQESEAVWHAALADRDQAIEEAIEAGYRPAVVYEAGELSKSQAAKRRAKRRAAQTAAGPE